jgi:hypothetical protein
VSMIQIFFAVSCSLAVLSFLLFVALVIERILTLETLRKRVAQGPVTAQELKGFEMQLQAGPLDVADKIIEATAKLTDSLAKAPMAVVALIASLLFTGFALIAVALSYKYDKKETSIQKSESVDIAVAHCLIGTFIEGKSQFQGSPRDSPQGCLEGTVKRLQSQPAVVLLVIGHVDLRELNTGPRRIYESNMSLAYQRAIAAGTLVTGKAGGRGPAPPDSPLAARTVLLAVGASNVRETGNIGKDRLAADRVAEIITLWNQPVRP